MKFRADNQPEKGEGMNVLSLFDGMSCGQIALERCGIEVENYFASEIDKYAIAVTQHNYPNTIQLGAITKWREWDIDWASIGIIMAGSPCQGFSFAGKQLAFDDPRSKLFFVFVDILNNIKKYNPNVIFLLENVRMKKEHLDVITEMLGVEPIKINSALVSAQNRVRYYWTNLPVEQPEDKGILLKDILEDGVESVGGAIRGRYNKDGSTSQKFESNGTEKANSLTTVQKDSLCHMVGHADLKGHDSVKRVYSPEGKSPYLTTMGGGHREPKVICGASVRGRNGKAKLELNNIPKANSLTTNTANSSLISDSIYWRKLTPLECERLQTVPDDYTAHVSNSQRYKMLGNGWTVDVIVHILKNLKETA